MNKRQALERVETLSRKIATGETSLEAWKWQRAEAMAEAADAGATQREIAKSAGMASSSANSHIQVARAFGVPEQRPPYSEAYDSVTGFDRDAAQDRTDAARTKKVLRESSPEKIASLLADPDISSNVVQAQHIAHKEAVEEIRRKADDSESLTSEDYEGIDERFGQIPERFVLVMNELLTALSQLRVTGVEKVIESAGAKERREWAERLPEEIALLQLALDLCKVQKLKAVKASGQAS